MKKPTTVDEYIAHAPQEIQERLTAIRRAIREAAPDAEEKISYGMPYYGYNGRLAYFAYASEHIGLYVPPPVIAEHKEELNAYGTAVATVRFPHTEKLPIPLIKTLIKARLKHIREKK